jgi:hypothetical protein
MSNKTRKKPATWKVTFSGPVNGRVRRGEAVFTNRDGKVLHTDRFNPMDAAERRKAALKAAPKVGGDPDDIEKAISAAWNKVYSEHLKAAAEDAKRPESPGCPGFPGPTYLVKEHRIYRCRHTAAGDVWEPLCNFEAHIREAVCIDDGSGELRHVFTVAGTLHDGTPLPDATVRAAEFAAMNWPLTAWGVQAIVSPGQGAKDHLRAAVQEMSRDAVRRTIFQHTGWRELAGGWGYLHAGGAITAAGLTTEVAVELESRLSRYCLPVPPEGTDLVRAVRAELGLLELTRPRVMVPVQGAVFRSVLGPVDCSLQLQGSTGTGKSEVAALAQQHFGAGMDRLHLPADWMCTATALEALAFAAKDALLVIDDFKPGEGRSDADQLQAKADRVLRAQGNLSGRQRGKADGGLRADRHPRGMILSTGEDAFRGESLQARVLPLPVHRDDFALTDLTPYQRDAAAGLYAQAMAGYLRWLAGRFARVRAGLKEAHAGLRDRAQGGAAHPRVPGVIADLALGWQHYLDFALEVGAVTAQEREDTFRQVWEALVEAGAEQAAEVAARDPCRRFLTLVLAALSSGRAHLTAPDGDCPPDPDRWGWRFQESPPDPGRWPGGVEASPTTGGVPTGQWRPLGHQIGWVEGENVYLDPESSYAEAQRLADEQGVRLPVSQRQLTRRLREQNLLASYERDRTTTTRTLQGRGRDVLHFRATLPPPGNRENRENRGPDVKDA